jgi:hypothetical protein
MARRRTRALSAALGLLGVLAPVATAHAAVAHPTAPATPSPPSAPVITAPTAPRAPVIVSPTAPRAPVIDSPTPPRVPTPAPAPAPPVSHASVSTPAPSPAPAAVWLPHLRDRSGTGKPRARPSHHRRARALSSAAGLRRADSGHSAGGSAWRVPSATVPLATSGSAVRHETARRTAGSKHRGTETPAISQDVAPLLPSSPAGLPASTATGGTGTGGAAAAFLVGAMLLLALALLPERLSLDLLPWRSALLGFRLERPG